MEIPFSQKLPKRVVLLFKLDDPNDDIIHAFLRYSNRQESEYHMNKHAVHLDPERDEHELQDVSGASCH
jgi:hypothetical protein